MRSSLRERSAQPRDPAPCTAPIPTRARRRQSKEHLGDNDRWLARILEEGRQDGTLRFSGPSRDAARMIVGTLQGSMLVVRPHGDVERFNATAARLIASFIPTDRAPSARARDAAPTK